MSSNYYADPQVHLMAARQSDGAVQSVRSRTIRRMLFIGAWLLHRPRQRNLLFPARPCCICLFPSGILSFSHPVSALEISVKVWPSFHEVVVLRTPAGSFTASQWQGDLFLGVYFLIEGSEIASTKLFLCM